MQKRRLFFFLAVGGALEASSCGYPGEEPGKLERQSSELTAIACFGAPSPVPVGYFRTACMGGSSKLPISTCTCYPTAPSNPIVALDYSMPPQTGVDTDGDGIVNLSPPGNPAVAGSYLPSSWNVVLNACASTPAPSYGWDISLTTGVVHQDTTGCSTTVNVPAQGKYHVQVGAKYSNGTWTVAKDIIVKNFLIVSIGDSIASGEGNPDVKQSSTGWRGGQTVQWENRSCHRSARSGPALAALQLERADPHSSVTFISEACSGAQIQMLPGVAGGGGVLTPYAGQESLPDGAKWPAQLAAVARVLCPANAALPTDPGPNWTNPVKDQCRPIDALVVQAGANDAGFGTAAKACSIPSFDCSTSGLVTSDIANGISALTSGLNTLASSINSGLNVNKVLLPEYPDIAHSETGALCTHITLPGAIADVATNGSSWFTAPIIRWGLSLGGVADGDLNSGEIQWLYDYLITPINQKVATVAQNNGWVLVSGIASDFRTHGYCSTSPWVVKYEESVWTQGNADGTFHPNAGGHAAYASRIASAIIGSVPGAAALAGTANTSTEVYTPGDFNGDGNTDVIITTDTGSYWYFSNGDGTWTVPYTRTDLPLGTVGYVPGDFNGDGKTDLIIATATGSYWYFSNGDGTWTVPYTRTDLPLGTVGYVPGDFNGDHKTDLVITIASGSYWYFSNGDGSWTAPYVRTDLPTSVASYVPGDFDGDGRTDLIITTPGGSYWYYSNGDGSWNNAYTRVDLPKGEPTFTIGDFNGDGRSDVIVMTASGSNWLFSMGLGSFSTLYSRSDLTTAVTQYIPGDFNGDNNTDLVIVNPSGSYWYFSNGDGSWTNPYSRYDLPLNFTRYVPGRFSADLKTDLIITNVSGSYWYFSNGDGTWTAPYVRGDLVL